MTRKEPRHPPSRELWRFCLAQLRRVRGSDVAEREVPRLLGFDDTRATRWKEGQMYVDRAEFLVKLAASLDLDVMLLMGLACGTVNAEQALRQAGHETSGQAISLPLPKALAKAKQELGADAAKFAVRPGHLGSARRGVVLLISDSGSSRTALAAALGDHAAVGGLVATDLPMGIVLAERYRPELIFLSMDAAGTMGLDACRAFSRLVSRSRRRCRVVAGSTTMTDMAQAAALMAGAGDVTSLPFAETFFRNELDRLEERLGS